MNLPIRVRLTAWYAALLAVILVALGSFVVLQLSADLRDRVDSDVRRAAQGIANGYAEDGPGELVQFARTALPRGASAVQVLDRGGRVLVAFGAADADTPLVPMEVRSDALLGDSSVVPIEAGRPPSHYRAYVVPVRRLGRRHVLVVAESVREAEAPTRRVLALLLLAGPAALAATALVGWWLARKALLPVDRMASAADAIEIDRLDERLAVPRARDELGHLAETLNAMLERLEYGVMEKRRLVADASHELRTPLAVMRAELDVTLRSGELDDEAREVLESAREEVDRMSRTVDNLLTLAQVDEGRLALLRTRVDLADAVEAAARPLRPLAEHKGVRVAVGGEPAETHADLQHLQLALTNLIENAIKFTPEGGEVRVSAWTAGDEVGVTVEDDGPGIPAEARAHVFDRFYRVDRARGRGGSGLGLAICDEIARAHGGRIDVAGEEGRGSTFSLTLPRDGAR
ncbi:MAG TPA: ATP-binding protein [Solirubrobacteraceae bacterium]|nr:ATP-binding protein [Solirubrobacteraceae bacterium]